MGRFARYYAERVGYPLAPASLDIGQVANYRPPQKPRPSDIDCKDDYLNYVKNHIYRLAKARASIRTRWTRPRPDRSFGVTEFAHLLGYPRFDRASRSRCCARQPALQDHLTTSPFTFWRMRCAGPAKTR